MKQIGNERGVAVRFDKKRGKGSHGTLYYGTARTIVQERKRTLPEGTLHAMVRQLGLVMKDFK